MKNFILILGLVFLLAETAVSEISPESSQSYFAQAQQTESKALELGKKWSGEVINNSISLYLDAHQRWRQIREFEKSSVCLREVSHFYILFGKNEEAVNNLINATKLDVNHRNLITKSKNLSLLAIAYLRLGKIANAKKTSEKSLSLAKKANSSEALAFAFFAKGQINYENIKFDTAILEYEQALRFWEESKSLKDQAKVLLELAYVYMSKDELLIGLDKARKSFDISIQINDLRGKVIAQNAIAVLKSKLGFKQEALNIFLESEKLFPNDIDFWERGCMYNHLAEIFFEYYEPKIALNYHLKALDLFQKEKHLSGQLVTLPRLGIINFQLNNESIGLEYFNTGLKLARQTESDYFFALMNQDLGNLYFETDKAKALKYFKIAQPIFENLEIRTHLAIIQSKVGMIYQSQGKIDTAREYFNSALKFNRETKNRFSEAQNLYNIANLYANENNYKTALDFAEQSISITENLSSEVINSKLKTTFFSSVAERYELYINLLVKRYEQSPNENYAVQALQAAEKSRARSMLENLSLAEVNFSKDATPGIVKREKEIRVLLNSKADKLTDLLSSNTEKIETEKLDNEINELEHELEEIKATLKQNSPIYSAIKNPAPFDIAEFQRNILDENSLLLEFSFGKEESYLWLVGKTEINSYVLPSRGQIESRIEKLRKLIDSRQILEGETTENYQARIAGDETEFEQEAQVFSNELLGQIADKIKDKRLIIVPDGKLHYFPIAALPFPNSTENIPILLTNETIYQPSAATLSLLTQIDKKPIVEPKNLLVFSDPIFSKQDPRISAASDENQNEMSFIKKENFRFAESLTALSRLNASRDEADSIVEIVGASDSTIFTGAAATRENALDAATADYKIVHFATHGLINEERPELSGIVLSQVNENGNNQNGVVRLQDIYAMNLTADLVVLSACSTGVGKEVKGEGLMSLNNAFLQTGAKTVISSLWKVDDYATRELMKNFYRELTSGTVTTSEALRRAQIKMRQNPQYQSPFYWAAFTVQGDFQSAPKLSGSFGSWIYTFFIVPFLLVGVYSYRRRFRLFNRKTVNKN
jgi:CHAT domain-containing protein